MRINIKLPFGYLFHYEGRTKLYKMIPGLIGMQSITQDRKHVIFLDFDRTRPSRIIKKIRQIQEEHLLGDFYLFKSSKENYHAICLDKKTMGEIIDIQLKLKMKKYSMFALMRGFWVLRISPKKENIRYIKTISSRHENETSYAHYKILKEIYPELPEPRIHDNSKGIRIDIYTSVNKK